MANNYQVQSHAVEAARIVRVAPLVARDKMLSPDAGLTLILETNLKHKWLPEKDGAMPVAGDWLVEDRELQIVFVVPAAKFAGLFKEN
jgi:hypothetical protein